jgi:hypothetical protein
MLPCHDGTHLSPASRATAHGVADGWNNGNNVRVRCQGQEGAMGDTTSGHQCHHVMRGDKLAEHPPHEAPPTTAMSYCSWGGKGCYMSGRGHVWDMMLHVSMHHQCFSFSVFSPLSLLPAPCISKITLYFSSFIKLA